MSPAYVFVFAHDFYTLLGALNCIEVYVGAVTRMWHSASLGKPSNVQGGTRARHTLGGVCLALVVVCASCSLDERTLLTTEATAGSSSAGGEPSVGDPAGGAAGEAPLPRCFYTDSAVESECETLVKNPGFALNVASWTGEMVGVTEGWLNADASDDPTSGSLVVTNVNYSELEDAKGGIAGGGARQCVPVTSGATYDLAADLFIPSGQGQGFEGTYASVAALSVFFYETASCDTQTIGNFTSDTVQISDQWVHVEASTKAPKESQSMAVRLATFKPLRQNTFEAHFDNVFVRERSTP